VRRLAVVLSLPQTNCISQWP